MSEKNTQPVQPSQFQPARGPKSEDKDPYEHTIDPSKRIVDGSRPPLDPTRFGDWEKNGRCIDF